MSNDITGPVDKVTNVDVDLGPRLIMADAKEGKDDRQTSIGR